MSARKPATRIVKVSFKTIEDLLEVALENYLRSIKELKNSDVVDEIKVLMTPPWEELVDVRIKLITPVRRMKKEVEHIIYNGS